MSRRCARGVVRAVVAVAALAGSPAPADEPIEAALTLAANAPARLVLPYWPERGWLVRQTGRLAELALPGIRLAIATGAVSLPAGSGAILGLNAETGEAASYLRLALGCDCTLAVHGDGVRLLIDVVGAERLAGPIRPAAGPAPRLARLPPPRGTRNIAETAARAPDFAETRSRLLEELRRAAEAGLVTLRSDAEGLLARIGDGSPAPLTAANPLKPGAAEAAVPGAGDLGTGPSVARAAEPVPPVTARYAGPPPLAPGAAADGPPASPGAPAEPAVADRRIDLVSRAPAPACIDNASFALPDPLPAGSFVQETARLRSALLAALAWLADERPLPQPNLLAVSGCEGQHALWQAFDAALGGRAAEARALEAQAAGALEQAARGLRGRIAVRLGLAAAEQGDWIAAYRLGAMAKRALAPDDREGHEMRRLLEALQLRGRGEIEVAVRWLAPLAAARSRVAERALIELAGIALEPTGAALVPLDPLRWDLGALVTMHRGTELGRKVLLAETRVTALLLGRDAGFDLLAYARAAGLVDEAGYHAALAEIGAAMPDREGETPLAVLYERSPASFARALEDAGFRLALTRSYLALGTPGLAEGVLRPADLADSELRRALADGYRELGDKAAAARLAGGPSTGPGQGAGPPDTAAVSGASGDQLALDPVPAAGGARADAAPSSTLALVADAALAGGRSAAPAEPAGAPAEAPAEAVRRLLETVSAEERLLEEMLNDG